MTRSRAFLLVNCCAWHMVGCTGWVLSGFTQEGCSADSEETSPPVHRGNNANDLPATPWRGCGTAIGWDASSPDDADAAVDASVGDASVCDASIRDASAGTPRRIVAVADLHGTIDAAVKILREAGLIDEKNEWIGGEAILVQVGDEVDRGPADRGVVDLFESLKREAAIAGGAVIAMTGNHEVMNVKWDFGFVSDASFAGFSDIPYNADDPQLLELPEERRGRAAAMRPGGPYAAIFADRPLVLKVGDTLFVHAGILPEIASAQRLQSLNRETRAWMQGSGPCPDELNDSQSPIWTRAYGAVDQTQIDCDEVSRVLFALCATRMVIGHTIQNEANAACDGMLFRIDVGMYQGEKLAALEIIGNETRIIEVPFQH